MLLKVGDYGYTTAGTRYEVIREDILRGAVISMFTASGFNVDTFLIEGTNKTKGGATLNPPKGNKPEGTERNYMFHSPVQTPAPASERVFVNIYQDIYDPSIITYGSPDSLERCRQHANKLVHKALVDTVEVTYKG